jgi:hypothetical protein
MSWPRPSKLLCAVTASIFAWAAAGCGHTAVVGPHRALHISLSEYRINPQSVRAPSGLLNIFVRNYGRRTHNLVLTLNGQAEASTKPLWPGATEQITVLLAPGTYYMASTILDDETLGEYGTLVVH